MHRFLVTVPLLTLALATGCPKKVAEPEPEPGADQTEVEPKQEAVGDPTPERKASAAPDPEETDEDPLDEEAQDPRPEEQDEGDEEDDNL